MSDSHKSARSKPRTRPLPDLSTYSGRPMVETDKVDEPDSDDSDLSDTEEARSSGTWAFSGISARLYCDAVGFVTIALHE